MFYISLSWAALAVAVLVFFIYKFTNTELSEMDVIHLPKFLFFFGCFLHLCGGALSAWALYSGYYFVPALGLVLSIIGIAAMMCQINQKTTMTSSSTFTYTTFLGNTREYTISDVTGFKVNTDSLTIFTTKGNIHVESIAKTDEHFLELLDKQLENRFQNQV